MRNKYGKKMKTIPLLALVLLFTPSYVDAAYTGIVENTIDGTTTTVTGQDLSTGTSSGNSAVLYTQNGGRIEMIGGSLSSYNVESVGSATAKDNGSIYLENVTISSAFTGTSGNKKTGLWADSGGKISMKGGSITTSQYDSYGVWAMSGGNVDLDGTSITTSGGNGMGLRVEGSSKVTMKGGSITLTGSGDLSALNAAAYTTGNARIEITNGTTIKTTSGHAYGLATDGTNTSISMTDGSVTTTGDRSLAVYSQGGTIDVNSVDIQTEGVSSYGVHTNRSGVINVQSSTIETLGSASGVYTYLGGVITVSNTDITTHGYRARGIMEAGGKIVVNGGQITTYGKMSHGAESSAYRRGTDSLTLNNVSIKTTGEEAHGLYTYARSSSLLNGGIIQVEGPGSYAIYTYEDGTVNGSGVYNIQGDIINQSNGNVNLDFNSGSHFKGASDMATGVLALNLAGTSQWDMTADSSLSTLNFTGSGGHVHFETDLSGGFGTLTLSNLTGNQGTFYMRTDIVGDGAGNNTGDLLVVADTSIGDHRLYITNQGSAESTGEERLTVVETSDGIATFGLDHLVELGGYQYNLRRVEGQESNWELYATPQIEKDKTPSTTADAAVNLFSGAYLLNYAETQTLLKRLGDLRNGTQDNGIWARVYGGKFQSSGDSFLKGYDMNYWGVQAGYDKKIERDDKKGVVYVGGFLGYSKGNLDYLNNGNGSIDSKSIGAYWTHLHHNGFYADAVFKYNWMKNDFKRLDSAGDLVNGSDINTQGFTGSLEVGRRYFLKTSENGEKVRVEDRQGWYIEPQAQLTVGQQSGARFTASNGLRIKADSYRSVMGRAEIHLGYEVKTGKNPVNIYGKFGVVKEFDGEVDYTLNGSRENTSYQDTWKLWGVGVTAKFSKKHDVYLEVERATGGQFTQSWGVNGGYRFSW